LQAEISDGIQEEVRMYIGIGTLLLVVLIVLLVLYVA
jgi:hypothetical protein